jgi:hypothetical protein
MTVIQAIANTLQWKANLEGKAMGQWNEPCETRMARLIDELPSGSGWDNGTTLGDDSTPSRIIFTGSYHHMNENGFYDGWTDHRIIVTPTFEGFDIRITGRDRNQIKEYLQQSFEYALSRTIDINSPRFSPWVELSADAGAVASTLPADFIDQDHDGLA